MTSTKNISANKRKHSDETKKLMSIAKLGNKNRLGYVVSQETKKKLSVKLKGNTNRKINHPVSIETRMKISAANINAIKNGFIPQDGIMRSRHGEILGKRFESGSEKKYILSCSQSELDVLISQPGKILTPFGWYFPDFELPDKYIEVKSKWTFSRMVEKQKLKIDWVNQNLKQVEIKVL